MIDFQTLCFLKKLDELAELSAYGIKPFSKATMENWHECVFYDETLSDNDDGFYVVLDACIDELHHDIICYCVDDRDGEDYSIRVVFDDDNKPFISIKPGCNNLYGYDWQIVIEDGQWNFV